MEQPTRNQGDPRWKRVEAGMYEMVGTAYSVHNMRGQSIKYSGVVLDPWVVYDGNKEIRTFPTKTDAQRYVEGL